MQKHRSNKMILERIPQRRKKRYEIAPSYEELGKSKPIKPGLNQKLPRPFRDVKIFKIEKTRSEKREAIKALRKKGDNKNTRRGLSNKVRN